MNDEDDPIFDVEDAAFRNMESRIAGEDKIEWFNVLSMVLSTVVFGAFLMTFGHMLRFDMMLTNGAKYFVTILAFVVAQVPPTLFYCLSKDSFNEKMFSLTLIILNTLLIATAFITQILDAYCL